MNSLDRDAGEKFKGLSGKGWAIFGFASDTGFVRRPYADPLMRDYRLVNSKRVGEVIIGQGFDRIYDESPVADQAVTPHAKKSPRIRGDSDALLS